VCVCVCVCVRGKYGSVSMCTELCSGRTFAAKFIRVRASQREEFRQEITVMNLLRHPKILLLWDAFETTRELILVMEQSVLSWFSARCKTVSRSVFNTPSNEFS